MPLRLSTPATRQTPYLAHVIIPLSFCSITIFSLNRQTTITQEGEKSGKRQGMFYVSS